MATVRLSRPRTKSLSDPEFKKRLQALRQTDNYRNWFYLVRTYGLLLLVIGGAIWFYQFTRAAGLSLLGTCQCSPWRSSSSVRCSITWQTWPTRPCTTRCSRIAT